MSTPYSDLSPKHFWRSGVADVHPTGLSDLYVKKFALSQQDKIVTAGSCFAQHVARHLKKHRYNVLDAEPAPFELPDHVASRFGYGIYSARYGNLYTARQLLQLLKDAEAGKASPEDVWEKKGRFFDAYRPSVEPDGLDTLDEALAHRQRHLELVDELFSSVDVLIFTLGLTETWVNHRTGAVYPTCPGVIAGTFDPDLYSFKNLEFEEVMQDMTEINTMLSARNDNFRMILTVSPVPLTATASGDHALVATTYSKSTLRAVCGSMRKRFDNVDYFPSYEIITSQGARGLFYEPNLRSVTEIGVETVMKTFFSQHAKGDSEPGRPSAEAARPPRKKRTRRTGEGDLVCEEVLLEAFAK